MMASLKAGLSRAAGLLLTTNLITDLSGNAWRRNLTYELQALGTLQISTRLTV